MKIVECVPNFSEGRNKEVIQELIASIQKGGKVKMLDWEADADHNRSVITFAGESEECLNAAFFGIARAAELIDMEKHKGEHPRLGATDVVPFVPISDVTLEECVELARRLGKKVGDELQIPVYLYEAAATRPERVNLATVRKGEYEGLKAEIEQNPDRKPDFGPEKVHPKAGGCIIGARMPLIAYNVYLNTDDINIAKQIAKVVREAGGGLPAVKALGFEIKARKQVQVSMNLTNYLKTPPHVAFKAVTKEAEKLGVEAVSSEVVGLIPQPALDVAGIHYLKLENFSANQILEEKLRKAGIGVGTPSFLDEVASSSPAPGGGASAAHTAALACALVAMVCRLTIGKKKYAGVEQEMKQTLETAETLRKYFENAVEEDTRAFNVVMQALGMPKETEEQKAARMQKMEEGSKAANVVPVAVLERVPKLLRLANTAAEKGNVNATSDAATAGSLAYAAAEGAYFNVLINLKGIFDKTYVSETHWKAKNYLQEAMAEKEKMRQISEKLLSLGD
ncbi:MAG TPA: glutamate formimidoyltransferase [candidate division Zixibacteria bacterium]|nr:glutamate formimidoyltransferase [candidate division Zixibacteria bacterium]